MYETSILNVKCFNKLILSTFESISYLLKVYNWCERPTNLHTSDIHHRIQNMRVNLNVHSFIT
jgi:hypothetical protein